MSIAANVVKELREKTNAGMMDCKKALEETKGDFEAAVEWLRKKGLASAAKKSGRVAAEGAVHAQSNGKTGVLVEINSETDFVARNDGFRTFVQDISQHALTNPQGDILTQNFAKTGKTVEESLKEVIATIGENIVVRRTLRYDLQGEGLIHTYIHGEGKIGVMVEVGGPSSSADVKTFAQDVCLHIAAMNPMALSADQMPADVVAKEREILKAKNLEQGKKADMVDKIVDGQIRKFLAESCLLDQAFVKNPDQKVSDYMKETGKKAGGDVSIRRFARFELGEGIEKKSTDFAAEVAAQMKGH
ncbi:MAG: elongation factor Ts [Bdellovibrionaceae bacterium]|nr:elongation factor Ts [Pseudobdellovibrionaceae bacterium]MBX3033740.1 elongation factor Ts [Pseudobdellovibrionaceae bacterium]